MIQNAGERFEGKATTLNNLVRKRKLIVEGDLNKILVKTCFVNMVKIDRRLVKVKLQG